jgi:uncharacterized flavoprotein (TIGR03862 family)
MTQTRLPDKPKPIAIVGAGPAALMAADLLSETQDLAVTIYEKRAGVGRKLLIAGSSGLNITHDLPLPEFLAHYTGPRAFWEPVLKNFTPENWIAFVEALGIPTFKGTSRRYFIEDMKASRFLKAWKDRLTARGVRFQLGSECTDFAREPSGKIRLTFSQGEPTHVDAVCFALGGGSYEPDEVPLRWPPIFARQGVGFTEFTAANVGYRVAWPEAFSKEAEGRPIKRVVLTTRKGSRAGEVMVTRYGLESTPVYFISARGEARLDLKPDLTAAEVEARLTEVKENLSPMRRIQKRLNLGPAALALIFHLGPPAILKGTDLRAVARLIKEFPIQLDEPQPIAEAISSAGGVHLDELNAGFMLKKHPGVFVAGEMLDWDVPTGGFLIQGCVAQGRAAARGILDYLGQSSTMLT